jgi:hypothetical protein
MIERRNEATTEKYLGHIQNPGILLWLHKNAKNAKNG